MVGLHTLCILHNRSTRTNARVLSRLLYSLSSEATRSPRSQAKFGFLIDIDGAFLDDAEGSARSAVKLMLNRDGDFNVPCVFMSSAGNMLRRLKSEKLSEKLGVKVSEEQIVLAHSPLKAFSAHHNKTILVSGQGPVRDIARDLGFKKVVTVDALRYSYPVLDMVDHSRRKAERGEFEEYFPEIEAIVLLGEPVRWETNLQLILDLLFTNGKPDYAPKKAPFPHLPLLACGVDMTWKSAACLPRIGHGCFLFFLECLYKKFAGHDLEYCALVGKGSAATFRHAERMLCEHAKQIGNGAGVQRLYFISDDHEAILHGANQYNHYLESGKESNLLGAEASKDMRQSAVLQGQKPTVATGNDSCKSASAAASTDGQARSCIPIFVSTSFSASHVPCYSEMSSKYQPPSAKPTLPNKSVVVSTLTHTCSDYVAAVEQAMAIERYN